MNGMDPALLLVLGDYARGQPGDDAVMAKKIKWMSSEFGTKGNFVKLIQYLITEAPAEAAQFRMHVATMVQAITDGDTVAYEQLVEDQFDLVITVLATTDLAIPPDPVKDWSEHTAQLLTASGGEFSFI